MMERKPIVEEPKKKEIPFKLCFVDTNVPGMSNIRIGRPLKIPEIIADKFYTDNRRKKERDIIERNIEKLKVLGPREKYIDPITENQKYGWYQIQLTDADRSDKRLFFHKQTSILVKEHLMNYAKIRE